MEAPKPRITAWDCIWQTSSKVSFDLYGYKPHYLSTYRTHLGMVLTCLMLGSWLGLTGYQFSQLFKSSFNIQEATIPEDPGFYATPATQLPVPRCLGGFRLNNGTGFYDPKYITFTWTQRFTYITPDGATDNTGNGACASTCVTSVAMETVPCWQAASDGTNNQTEMRCARPISRPGASNLPTVYDGQLPAFQGQYGDPTYAFLQLEVNLNVTALDQEPAMAELLYNGGQTFVSVDWQGYTVGGVTLRTTFDTHPVITSQRWYAQRSQAPRMEWTVRRRTIKVKSPIFALNALDQKYNDFILGLPATAYTDTPARKPNESAADARARGLILKVYFHMDMLENLVTLQPVNTVIGFIASTGGLVTILGLFFGTIGRWYSFVSYVHHTNVAYAQGTLPESHFERPGSCRLRIEDTNRSVSILNRMQPSGKDLVNRVKSAPQRAMSLVSAKSGELMSKISMSRSTTASTSVALDLDPPADTKISDADIPDKLQGRV